MTTTITAKATNFKLLQPEVAEALCKVFQQIDEMRAIKGLDQPVEVSLGKWLAENMPKR